MTLAVPVGETAMRLQWHFLPPMLRRAIEQRCGAEVVETISCDAGFTPGFASALFCADGSRHFVKAASVRAQQMFANSYKVEALKLAALPPDVAAPRLLWSMGTELDGADDEWVGEWVVLGIEYVEARAPHRPWSREDLDAVLTMLAQASAALTPMPPALLADPVGVEFAGWPQLWSSTALRDWPHAERAEALASRFVEVSAGDTLVHCDVRDDNLLITPAGKVLLCDWNWPVRGAAWLDSFFALIGPRGDGVDVDSAIAATPLLAEVPSDHLDVMLALLAGYFLKSSADPVPPTSPYLRDVQRWQGEVCWDWLCERRGWT